MMSEYEDLQNGFFRLMEEIEAGDIKGKEKYRGHHNGTVFGKWFERSRRARKSHAQRRADIVARSIKR
jgi:hypothetical protein